MKNRADKYPQGQRVRYSDAQVHQFPKMRGTEGVIKGAPHTPCLIRVLQDGKNAPATWDPMFWEPIEP